MMTRRKTVGTAIPARYARKYGCLFMTVPSSQVVQQRRDDSRENAKHASNGREQCPIPPRHSNRALIEPLQQGRPQIAPKFAVPSRGQRILQQFLHIVNFRFLHGCTPACDKVFLKRRTPRNTRTFTAFSEIPSASAMRS